VKPTIIVGYDVETASESTVGFLEGAAALHTRLGIPWAIYVTGETFEKHADMIAGMASDPLLTVGQHTYSHVLLKTIYMTPQDGRPVHGSYPSFIKVGASLDKIREELGRTQALIEDTLATRCRGLTGPWGYYRGLADRPDILAIIEEYGLCWIRTNARECRDCQPTPFTEQPFFYRDQGFPEILELGIHGYQDDFYWERFDNRRYGDTYLDYLIGKLDEVLSAGQVWSFCSHDHGTPSKAVFDKTRGMWLKRFFDRAIELGFRFVGPGQLYKELQAGSG